MPDGSASRRTGRVGEKNGKYFCKWDKSGRTISIYTCKGRQTVRIPDTETRTVEDAELALAKFVLTNAEAAERERRGITACDLPVTEALAIYFVARQSFHENNLKRITDLIADATRANGAELTRALYGELKSAKKAKSLEEATIRNVAGSVEKCWKDLPMPKASELDKTGQLHYVKRMREFGYADSSIRTWLVRIFTALQHCVEEKRQRKDMVPARLRADKWMIFEDREVVSYSDAEMIAMFKKAQDDEAEWKYMNVETHGMRPMTAIEMYWLQITLGEEPRINLNPPGKRLTKKRRPLIPICPSLAAEMAGWSRDHQRVISDGTGRAPKTQHLFRNIKAGAGVTRGSANSLRKTMRTWCARQAVPDVIADWFFGHKGDGSATGDTFYKDKQPGYMGAVMVALEAFYAMLRAGGVTRLGPVITCVSADFSEDQPAPGAALEAIPAALRVRSVTEKLLMG